MQGKFAVGARPGRGQPAIALGGRGRNRTGIKGFAVLRMSHSATRPMVLSFSAKRFMGAHIRYGAGDGQPSRREGPRSWRCQAPRRGYMMRPTSIEEVAG